jgi:hypothetical protein
MSPEGTSGSRKKAWPLGDIFMTDSSEYSFCAVMLEEVGLDSEFRFRSIERVMYKSFEEPNQLASRVSIP